MTPPPPAATTMPRMHYTIYKTMQTNMRTATLHHLQERGDAALRRPQRGAAEERTAAFVPPRAPRRGGVGDAY
jgi:hypothetical protein